MSMCISTAQAAGSHLSGVVGFASGIFPVNFHKMAFAIFCVLLWRVHVKFDCAGSHKMMSPEVSPVVFTVKFHTKWLLWNVHVHVACAGSTLLFLIRQIFRWFLEAHCLGSLGGIIFLARNGVCCMPENAYLDWEEGAFQIMRSLGGTKSLNRSIWRTNPFPRNMICKWCIFHIPVCGW
jgi:hypothetical protein